MQSCEVQQWRRMYGFRKKAKKDHSIIALHPVEYQTRATWMDLPGSVLQPDIQSIGELFTPWSTREALQFAINFSGYFLLLYELQKGGWEELLSQAVRLMKECPCESGCPNCIVAPRRLEKAGALKIGQPQPKLPPRPKKTFAQCFNCGGGPAAQSVCMDLD
ncbi:hypothetical protein AK812_SmicGene19132 [Symbiodinium microadriaticum]|uniref:MrfA-like Zn-binding domain-containing protein n=1 Tax=Symbiodinium microadriaticum TaxID=2951 RepID=A0A1Q9DTF4_SYMMI|nr:hypothetical protein AK812_SmicGene19132 [Symbiodinium microadriaticum]